MTRTRKVVRSCRMACMAPRCAVGRGPTPASCGASDDSVVLRAGTEGRANVRLWLRVRSTCPRPDEPRHFDATTRVSFAATPCLDMQRP